MDKWSESNLVRWFVLIGCIACILFAGWKVIRMWRGPTPASIDPNITPAVRWGRPNLRKTPGADETPVPGDSAK